MTRLKAVWGAGILICLFGLTLTGCGRSDHQASEDTVRAFMVAIHSGDTAGWVATLTSSARDEVNRPAAQNGTENSRVSDISHGIGYDNYAVGEVMIDGDNAEVRVIVTQAGNEVPFTFKERREAGDWRIYAVRAEKDNSTLDFEHVEESLSERNLWNG